MKPLKERDYRELFRIGVLVKAADGILELVGGIFIYFFINADVVTQTLLYIFRNEIAETPHDTIWAYALNVWHSFSLQGHTFWGLLFMAHGAVKTFLAVALLKNQIWAYPISIAVYTLFVVYEIYSFSTQASLFLGLVIILDMIVIGLIIHEYRVIKTKTA